MNEFEFNGDWSYEVELTAFAGFQSRNGAYTSIDSDSPNTGKIKIEIEDDLTESPDPYLEQLNAIKFIFENQAAIVKGILSRALEKMPEIVVDYGLTEEDKYHNLTEEKMRSLLSFKTISIKIPSKGEASYFDVVGGCEWDEEHGLNVLMHKDRVITLGGIEGNSYWDAIKDNGTYEEVSSRTEARHLPRKFKPHPKYKKLKPSHKFANETFEYSLISGGHNEEFKKLVEIGEIDINGKWESQDKTFLESACWFNNNELVLYLLQKGAGVRFALHQCVGYNSNPEGFDLILKNGGDINQQDLSGNTILHLEGQELAKLYDYKQQSILYEWGRESELDEKIEAKKKFIRILILKGSNPRLSNEYQFDVYDLAKNLNKENKKDFMTFVDGCNNRNDSSKKGWKFWKK